MNNKKCNLCGKIIGMQKLQLKDGYICTKCMKKSGWGSWGFTSFAAFKWAKAHTFNELQDFLKEGKNRKDAALLYMNKHNDLKEKQNQNSNNETFHDIVINSSITSANKDIEKLNIPNNLKQQLIDSESFDFFGVKKELKFIPEIINLNKEKIVYACSGMLNTHTWLIICTDQRLIFLNKNMIYGMQQKVIPLNVINAVTFTQKLTLGTISITNGANVTTIESVNKMAVPIMAAKIQKAKNNLLNPSQSNYSNSELDDLRKLKALLDDHIITQSEFDAKKKQMLGL